MNADICSGGRRASFAGESSERSNNSGGSASAGKEEVIDCFSNQLAKMDSGFTFNTPKLPCRPKVPNTTAQLPLPRSMSPFFAVLTASPRTLRISRCSYVSRVNFFEYGSYRNAGTVGLAIMIDSRWKRPSPTYLDGSVEVKWKTDDSHERIDVVQFRSSTAEDFTRAQRLRLGDGDLVSSSPDPDIGSPHLSQHPFAFFVNSVLLYWRKRDFEVGPQRLNGGDKLYRRHERESGRLVPRLIVHFRFWCHVVRVEGDLQSATGLGRFSFEDSTAKSRAGGREIAPDGK